MREVIILCAGILLLWGTPGQAQDTARLRKGTVFLSGEGYYRHHSEGEIEKIQTATLQPGVYYFCSNHLAVGTTGTYSFENLKQSAFKAGRHRRTISLTPELHARVYGPYLLYLDLMAGYVFALHEDSAVNETFQEVGVEFGKDLFLFSHVALESYVRYRRQKDTGLNGYGYLAPTERTVQAGVRLVVVL